MREVQEVARIFQVTISDTNCYAMVQLSLTSFAPDVSSLLAKRGANSGTLSPMKKIPLRGKLGSGKYATVDDGDYPILNKIRWHIDFGGYVLSSVRIGKKSINVRMHHAVLSQKEGLETDHINGDKLDNRKTNLRLCTKSENANNKGLRKNNTTGYKGVSPSKRHGGFRAHINVRGIQISLGGFVNLKDAARAYNVAALKYQGKFAKLNKI